MLHHVNAAAPVPADGPDAVLSRIAALLKLPHTRPQIARALAAHPRPTSLLAVVEVGIQLGLKMTPVKCNEAALAEQTPPMIAHFENPEGGGLAVVETVSTEGFDIWDSANGRRRVERDEFLEHWSGLLVLAEAADSAATSTASGIQRRLADALAGPQESPAVVGSRFAPIVRAAFALLILMSVGIAIWTQPAETRAASSVIAALSGAGMALTALMSIAISDYAGPFAPGICRRGRFVDCQSVLTSRFARVFGFPLTDLGIAFYGAILLLLATQGGTPAALAILRIAFVMTIPIALVLIGIQISLRRLCILCLGVHAVNFTAAAVATLWLPSAAPATNWVHSAALLVLFSLVLLFLVVPYLKQWKTLARLMPAHARLAASPFGSLAQLVTETPTPLDGRACGIELGGSTASDELVAFVHPSCKQCDPVLREIRSLAAGGRVHAFAVVPPRDASEDGVCATIFATGLAYGPEMMLRAYSAVKDRWGKKPAGDPVSLLTTELSLSAEELATYAADAQEMVRRAQDFATNHVEGTPALFFNSLPYRGPLSHLLTLLSEHSELLPRSRPSQDDRRTDQVSRT